jgi:hypothetical protein
MSRTFLCGPNLNRESCRVHLRKSGDPGSPSPRASKLDRLGSGSEQVVKDMRMVVIRVLDEWCPFWPGYHLYCPAGASLPAFALPLAPGSYSEHPWSSSTPAAMAGQSEEHGDLLSKEWPEADIPLRGAPERKWTYSRLSAARVPPENLILRHTSRFRRSPYRRGGLPVQRLNACVKAPTSCKPSSQVIRRLIGSHRAGNVAPGPA